MFLVLVDRRHLMKFNLVSGRREDIFILTLPPSVASEATYTGRTLHCSNALTTSACQWEEPTPLLAQSSQ
jgi:hypothetical protein